MRKGYNRTVFRVLLIFGVMSILYYESLELSKYSVLLYVIHLRCLLPTSSYQVSK